MVAARTMLVGLAAVLLTCGCTADRSATSTSTSPRSPEVSHGARLTVLGDSNASRTSCGACSIFPERVAIAMGKALSTKVELVNLSWEIGRPKAAEIADIVRYVRSSGAARDALSGSDAVLILVSQNDLAYNRLDDPCRVASRYPRVRWSRLTHACIDATLRDYARDLEELLDEIDTLRAHRPTVLRIVSAYNTAIGDLVDPTWNSSEAVEPTAYNVARMAAIQCRAAERHGGLCVDALHAFNGDGHRSAQRFLSSEDATHLSQAGHDRIAELVIEQGFSPVEAKG